MGWMVGLHLNRTKMWGEIGVNCIHSGDGMRLKDILLKGEDQQETDRDTSTTHGSKISITIVGIS